jgi:hypothetical protein
MQHNVYTTTLVRNFSTAFMVANVNLFTKITNVSVILWLLELAKKFHAVDIF